MDSSTVPDDRAVVTTTITVEDAQRAVQAINAYMANWPPDSTGQESAFRGARVTFLRAFRDPNVPGGVTWVPGFDRAFYVSLLFCIDDQGAAWTQNTALFIEKDLYPSDNQVVKQEGGIS